MHRRRQQWNVWVRTEETEWAAWRSTGMGASWHPCSSECRALTNFFTYIDLALDTITWLLRHNFGVQPHCFCLARLLALSYASTV